MQIMAKTESFNIIVLILTILYSDIRIYNWHIRFHITKCCSWDFPLKTCLSALVLAEVPAIQMLKVL